LRRALRRWESAAGCWSGAVNGGGEGGVLSIDRVLHG
jgi:hypothetical protein